MTSSRGKGGIIEVLDILTKLETSVNTLRRVPVMGKALVDTNQLAALVRELRQAMPPDLQSAREILQQRQHLLDQALGEASRVRTQAEEEARQRVEHSETTLEAQGRAEQIVHEAEQRAQRLVADAERRIKKMQEEAEAFVQQRTVGADQYARDVLLHLEEEMSRLLGSVRKGIDSLNVEREVRT